MKIITKIAFTIILSCQVLHSQQKEVDSIRVFYLGGQSNMDGYGYNVDLPETLKKTYENVWIFHGNPVGDNQINGGLGKWDILKPGHGFNFSSNGISNNLSDRFGMELSFANRLQELYPNEKIGIIKYSRGGSSIDSLAAGEYGSWEPDYQGTNGINQYDNFLNTIKNALYAKDIDSNGKEDYLIPTGIIWMQGESDAAYTEEIAGRYYLNLKRLMDLIRASFLTDDLPVIICKISDSGNDKDGKVWDYGELVQYAQEKYTKTDDNAAIIRETKYYKYSDHAHYDSNGYIDLGKKCADAVYQLINLNIDNQN